MRRSPALRWPGTDSPEPQPWHCSASGKHRARQRLLNAKSAVWQEGFPHQAANTARRAVERMINGTLGTANQRTRYRGLLAGSLVLCTLGSSVAESRPPDRIRRLDGSRVSIHEADSFARKTLEAAHVT